jgi:hypothetical protein
MFIYLSIFCPQLGIMRGWVGVEKEVLTKMAVSKLPQAFGESTKQNHPRTLLHKGFSVFDSAQPTFFMLQLTHPRNRTLKTKYINAFRRPLLQFHLLPNRD